MARAFRRVPAKVRDLREFADAVIPERAGETAGAAAESNDADVKPTPLTPEAKPSKSTKAKASDE
jgi:hypothetical protein